MGELAIRAEGLGKLYRIQAEESYDTLRDVLANSLWTPLRQFQNKIKSELRISRTESRNGRSEPLPNGDQRGDYVWALRDLSFEVYRGEAIGIVGGNGSGKSTLLKLLSRITEPTEGYAEVHGPVGTLLEVGTGFHPDLTGQENVYLNGAILGMRKADIDRKFDEIVAFAEVEKFIHTPVKHYSSGMYVRLAFAVAAHLEPEILLIDEVLAVGDIAFQRKCLGKMENVAKEGRTVIFISHNLEAVQKLCRRCLLLENGELVLDRDAETVAAQYVKHSLSKIPLSYEISDSGTYANQQKVSLLEAEILNADGIRCNYLRFGEDFTVRMLWEQKSDILNLSYAIRVSDNYDRLIFAVNTINSSLKTDRRGVHEILCRVRPNILVPGEYRISVGAYVRPHTTLHVVDPCMKLIVLDTAHLPDHTFNIVGKPLVALRPSWDMKTA
jgi:homopolymeric O-antigen transport system ATP-binding protein